MITTTVTLMIPMLPPLPLPHRTVRRRGFALEGEEGAFFLPLAEETAAILLTTLLASLRRLAPLTLQQQWGAIGVGPISSNSKCNSDDRGPPPRRATPAATRAATRSCHRSEGRQSAQQEPTSYAPPAFKSSGSPAVPSRISHISSSNNHRSEGMLGAQFRRLLQRQSQLQRSQPPRGAHHLLRHSSLLATDLSSSREIRLVTKRSFLVTPPPLPPR